MLNQKTRRERARVREKTKIVHHHLSFIFDTRTNTSRHNFKMYRWTNGKWYCSHCQVYKFDNVGYSVTYISSWLKFLCWLNTINACIFFHIHLVLLMDFIVWTSNKCNWQIKIVHCMWVCVWILGTIFSSSHSVSFKYIDWRHFFSKFHWDEESWRHINFQSLWK